MTGLLRDTLEEWSGEAQVPHDLADRALRRRSRRPMVALVAVAALAVGVTVPIVVSGEKVAEGPITTVTSPAPTDVLADTENNPPKKLIAAGRFAVSAYHVMSTEKLEGKLERRRWTWSLYNPVTGGYEETPWAWVDVAPGMQRAAVLEGDGLGSRLGILDMNSREFVSWIDLEHAAGSVLWSPDGTKVLLTTYTEYPDRWKRTGENSFTTFPSTRTGYYLVDVATGQAAFHALPPDSDGFGAGNNRQDLRWSVDGSLVAAPRSDGENPWTYYALDGSEQPKPESETSRVSPDGRLVLGESGMPTSITELKTGAVVGRQEVLQLLAWADNEHVIALGCIGTCKTEFNNGLVLVSVDGSQITPLSAARANSNEDGTWQWVLTPR